MRRWLAACAVLAACSRTVDGGSPATAPPPRRDALACTVDAAVERLATSQKQLGTLEVLVAVATGPSTDPRGGARFLAAFAERAATARRPPMAPAIVEARVASALLELGETRRADELVERALARASAPGSVERQLVLEAAAMIRGATGREPPPTAESEQVFAKLRRVEGLARGHQLDRARALFSDYPTVGIGTAEMGAFVVAAGWVGDDDAARAALDQDPTPVLRAWYAKAVVAAGRPNALALVDEQLTRIGAMAKDAPHERILEIAWMWGELVRVREKVAPVSSHEVRAAYDTWLLAADDERAQLRNMHHVIALAAGNATEARRLEQRVVIPFSSEQTMELAVLRGDIAGALDVLERYREPPFSGASPFGALDGDFAPSATMWLLLSGRKLEPRLVDRFDAIACRDQ